jgi:hypothetical protein
VTAKEILCYGVKVADRHGTSFILTGPTGRSEMARDFDGLCSAGR